jgi:hypothetical protein
MKLRPIFHWNLNPISFNLPNWIKQTILATPIPLFHYKEDCKVIEADFSQAQT